MDVTTKRAQLRGGPIEQTSAILQTMSGTKFRDDSPERRALDALAAAVYLIDAEGKITYYNDAAAALWGHRPELGRTYWCGSWKLRWPDGRPLPHDQSPTAVALKERRPVLGQEAIAERRDGTLAPVIAYPTPIFDESGQLTGAVCMLIDISDRRDADRAAQQFKSLVESAEDAILSKDLDGVITSWNKGAERLFGYAADEVIGKSVTILIPEDRLDEEPEILSRIRRGERVEHYETVRLRKDGSHIHIGLTVSPIRNAAQQIVGASKVARDISERRQALEQQRLLLREMDHRIKNLFTLAGSIVSLSARGADTTSELASAVQARLAALARAHVLTLPVISGAEPPAGSATTLHTLIRAIAAPYEDEQSDGSPRFVITGPDVPVVARSLASLALLLHEFATNAAKYGALSTPGGRVEIACRDDSETFHVTWSESGGPSVRAPESEGFGSLLGRLTVKGQLDGEISRDWRPEGLVIQLTVNPERLTK